MSSSVPLKPVGTLSFLCQPIQISFHMQSRCRNDTCRDRLPQPDGLVRHVQPTALPLPAKASIGCRNSATCCCLLPRSSTLSFPPVNSPGPCPQALASGIKSISSIPQRAAASAPAWLTTQKQLLNTRGDRKLPFFESFLRSSHKRFKEEDERRDYFQFLVVYYFICRQSIFPLQLLPCLFVTK